MQYEQAKNLREEWEAAGSKPCQHPRLVKEYFNGQDSGDKVCDTCGEEFTSDEASKITKGEKK